MQQAWAITKATAASQAWHLQFGAWPSLHAVILQLAQATAETRCGDAWPGPDGQLGTADDENNWGACNLRALNAAERAVLKAAGIVPTVGAGHEQRAVQAQAAIAAAGLPIPRGAIHCDSAPGQGPYFVWFAAFHDYTAGGVRVSGAVSGARYQQRIAYGAPHYLKSLYSVVTNPASDAGAYARAAYRQGYYTGTSTDPEVNIARYVQFMGRFVPTFEQLLAGFDPSACTPVLAPPPRLPIFEGMQGEDVKHPQLVFGVNPDGRWGAKTTAACLDWRRSHALSARAEWDQACEEVLAGKPADAEPAAPRIHLVELDPDHDAMRAERDREFARAEAA